MSWRELWNSLDPGETVYVLHLHGAMLSLGVAQALFGFAVGRWLHTAVRVILAAAFILTGYYACRGSAHRFGWYLWGILVYAAFCAIGLNRKATRRNIPFKAYVHVDWVAVLCSALVFAVMYR